MIFSEELILRDPTYQLKQSGIVTQVRDGYIIKKDGTYYLYLTDATYAECPFSGEVLSKRLVSASKRMPKNLEQAHRDFSQPSRAHVKEEQ